MFRQTFRENDNLIIRLFDCRIFPAINWRIIALLSSGIVRLQNFFKEAQIRNWNIKVYQFRKGIPYRDTFWTIKREHEFNIVLDVKRENIYSALKHVTDISIMHHLFRSSALPQHRMRCSSRIFRSFPPCYLLLLSYHRRHHHWCPLTLGMT